MNDPLLANNHPDILLSSVDIARLLDNCDRILQVQPQLTPWIRLVRVTNSLNGELTLPFLPIRCFRLFPVTQLMDCGSPTSTTIIQTFRSSGSTQEVRASHHMGESGLASYRQASVEGFRSAAHRFGIAEDTPIISLVPSPSDWPESSLAAMISFWKDAGLDVRHVDVEHAPAALHSFFRAHATDPQLRSCVVFGTSLHHLTVARWHMLHGGRSPFISARRIWFFDTGGTKGRTLQTTHEVLQAQMREWVNGEADVQFLSEYGMCELSSQAYSTHSPHQSTFQCSPTLHALSIQPHLNSACALGSVGFLGFIDEANVESWPFILTEDLGEIIDPHERTFRLLGRAPDATIKGCSLNVKSNFRFDLSEGQECNTTTRELNSKHHSGHLGTNYSMLKKAESAARSRFQIDPLRLTDLLTTPEWDLGFKEDLAASLVRWNNSEQEKELIEECALNGQSLAIVASANIAITWLFPAVHAWLMGARQVDLHLPSIRDEDPISQIVRRQIKSLALAFNTLSSESFITVHDHRLPDDTSADRIVVFGHDETIRSLRANLQHSKRQLPVIGLGHFQNKIVIKDSDSPQSVALQTSRWLGRGCLTPLLGILPHTWSTQQSQIFAREWCSAMSSRLKLDFPSIFRTKLQKQIQFAHRHNLAECSARAQTFSLPVTFHESSSEAVVCLGLEGCTADQIEAASLTQKIPDWGGCGWLTLVPANQLPSAWINMKQESNSPTLWEPHQGRFWRDWLLHE